jgi:hypothetical protein
MLGLAACAFCIHLLSSAASRLHVGLAWPLVLSLRICWSQLHVDRSRPHACLAWLLVLSVRIR